MGSWFSKTKSKVQEREVNATKKQKVYLYSK